MNRGSYSGRINTKLLKGKDFYHCYWIFFNFQIFVIYISKKLYIIGYIFIQISTNTVLSTQQACGRLAASETNRKAVNTACSLGSHIHQRPKNMNSYLCISGVNTITRWRLRLYWKLYINNYANTSGLKCTRYIVYAAWFLTLLGCMPWIMQHILVLSINCSQPSQHWPPLDL